MCFYFASFCSFLKRLLITNSQWADYRIVLAVYLHAYSRSENILLPNAVPTLEQNEPKVPNIPCNKIFQIHFSMKYSTRLLRIVQMLMPQYIRSPDYNTLLIPRYCIFILPISNRRYY